MEFSINVPLLQQVKEQISNHPDSFDMSVYVSEIDVPEESTCRTVACIAGHAVMLSAEPDSPVWNDIEDGYEDAIELEATALVLNMDREEVLRRKFENDLHVNLFGVLRWPAVLHAEYRQANTDAERAAVAYKAIDYYIANPNELVDETKEKGEESDTHYWI